MKNLTLREIGVLGVSESRVSQIHSQLKRRIRERLEPETLLFTEVRLSPRAGRYPRTRVSLQRTGRAVNRPPDRQTRILIFNVTFFGTLSWLGAGAQAAESGDWWHRAGQLPLMLAGLILFWMGWWHADHARDRQALIAYGPAAAILSVWITSVHGAVF